MSGDSPGEIRAALVEEAHRILVEDVLANAAMGEAGAAVVPPSARILTHCNAGALATGGYGTALGVVRSAHRQGKVASVLADETRPFLQGARLTAWELHKDGIPVTLIADNMAGHLMKSGEVSLVVVGADRVAANGDAANKIGTYSLAVLAREHGIPFYVAAPISTFDLTLARGEDIPIEERDPREVLEWGTVRMAPEGVSARYPAFDVTPHSLISGIITERGILSPPLPERIRSTVAPR
jgi:methylthioribose-1-phosphate isomerase